MMTEEKKIKIDQAEKLYRQKKYREAIVLCEEIHKDYPEDESSLLILSWAYYDSGEVVQAEKYLHILLERELKRKVFTGFAFDELVRIYNQQKDFQKLTEICGRAVAAQPEDVGLLTELGNAYLKSGQPEKACAIYEKLVEAENDNPAYYCYWGEALFAAGQNKKSEEAYRKAGEIDSEQADRYYFKIAVLFQQAGDYKEAERLLQKCIAADSINPLYYCSLGDSLVNLGQIRKALEAYEKAVQCDPSRAGAYYNRLGHSFLKNGNFSQAAETFESAINYEPVKPYYLSLASAYKAMGLMEKAESIIRGLDGIK